MRQPSAGVAEEQDKEIVHCSGQISPEWDISGTFSDQISVHFGKVSKPWIEMLSKKCPGFV